MTAIDEGLVLGRSSAFSGAVRVFQLLLRAGVPTILWGAPGIGKTALVRQVAAELAWALFEINAPGREPSDFAGYAVPTGDGLEFRPGPGIKAFAARALEAGGGVLFIDEATCAPPAVQAALLRPTLEGYIGDYQLPSCVRVVLSANPPEQAAGGWDLEQALAGRLSYITVEPPTHEEWASWLASRSVRECDSATWRGLQGQHARALVAGFLHERSDLLFKPAETATERGRQSPSPRSWEKATRGLAEVLAEAAQRGLQPAELVELGVEVMAPSVGPGAALVFADYFRGTRLPEPMQLLARPEAWTPDTAHQDVVWATLARVLAFVRADLGPRGTIKRPSWLAAWELHRIAREAGLGGLAMGALGRGLAREIQAGGLAAGLPAPPEGRMVLDYCRRAVS